MDGCHHKFNGSDEWCLIAAIDDATSEIPYAEFFEGETTQGCLAVLKRIIERKGIPKAIYTDRAGWAGGGKRINFSQFKRACDQLGIQLIFANSPEGKGRIERSFRTIQDRLIPELRINKITSMPEANRYLQDKFLPDYWNKENTVQPQNKEPAYSPPNPFQDLSLILCVEETRKIANDRTVSWQGQRYRVVDEQYAYGSFEAIFRTDLEGHTRVFVRDREVALELIEEPIREPVSAHEKLILDKRVYGEMLRLVDRVHTAVREHRVTGRPLKMPRAKKRA